MAKEPSKNDFYVETMYGAMTKQPLVKISYDDQPLCMINPKEAVLLAINLIQAANAAISDAFLFEFMADSGLPPEQAAHMMGEFRKWRVAKNYDLGDDLIQGNRRHPR